MNTVTGINKVMRSRSREGKGCKTNESSNSRKSSLWGIYKFPWTPQSTSYLDQILRPWRQYMHAAPFRTLIINVSTGKMTRRKLIYQVRFLEFLKLVPVYKDPANYMQPFLDHQSCNSYITIGTIIIIIQGDPKSFVPIFYFIKNQFCNECLFCCRTWKVNLWMIVCSYSCPKNVLDKSAEDILPGGLFLGQKKVFVFSSTLQKHSHIVTRFSLSASVSFLHLYP
jgi:hypothetical protein